MHEVDGDVLSGEHVGGPAKAVGRLEGDLDLTAMGGHRLHELERAVVDAYAAEQLALVVHRCDHRAPAVQVDSDVTAW